MGNYTCAYIVLAMGIAALIDYNHYHNPINMFMSMIYFGIFGLNHYIAKKQ